MMGKGKCDYECFDPANLPVLATLASFYAVGCP